MLAKTGLLIVTNPKHIGKILPSIQKQVKKTLYIHLLSALTEPFGNFYPNTFTSWPKYSQTIYGIYSQAATHCRDLDVRVLLSGLKRSDVGKIRTNQNIDLVIFDKLHNPLEVENFVTGNIHTAANKPKVITLDSGKFEDVELPTENGSVFKHTVLGGTFDRLHIAHKLLLSEAALRSGATVTVGVTEDSMLKKKVLYELIEDITVRLNNVKDFLTDICPELEYQIVPISDPFGPAIVDPTMDLIVVSEETINGGHKINDIRLSNNLSPLEVVPVKLIDEPFPNPNEEAKISSSTTRLRILGTLVKPVPIRDDIPKKPYVIGLTGGVASGKSGVAKWLQSHAVEFINCDLIGHQVYKVGKPCHKSIVDEFGNSVLTPEGEINRAALGAIVFSDKEKMQKLNALVWPAIAQEVQNIIKSTQNKVVVVEAAILIAAGWHRFCHEVWATFVPREEAVARLKSSRNLSEERSTSIVDAQATNQSNLQHANVVFCTLWEPEYTKIQVDKAWALLQKRIL